MFNSKVIAGGVLGALLGSTAAMAGGMDRSTFSPGVLFKDGDYVEFALGVTNPSITPAVAPVNVAQSFNTARLSYRQELSDKFALGFIVNTQPLGVDINYARLGSPLAGSVSSTSAILMGLYNATDRISAFGGVKYQTANGTANLTPLGIPEPTNFESDSGFGFVAGVAYSIPDIALRVSLSYESEIDFEHDTVGALSGTNYGATSFGAPEALTLEFQTGIAEDTLLFGSVRRAKWSESDVILPAAFGGTNLSSFDDTTAYSLGIGRRISDSFSMSVSLSYEEKSGDPVSPLAPTDGLFGISVGGEYTSPSGVVTALGISYSPRGDATTTTGLDFVDNEVITMGLRIGKSF